MKKSLFLFLAFLLLAPCASWGKDLYEEQLDRGIRNTEPYSALLMDAAKKERE